MRKLFRTAAIVGSILIAATPAMADQFTHLCRVAHKSYPVILRYDCNDSGDALQKDGTITWRGTTYGDMKLGEGCRYEFLATNNGVTVDLCTMTHGVADLTIGGDPTKAKAHFECLMPGVPHSADE
jgi:hypothetical protein